MRTEGLREIAADILTMRSGGRSGGLQKEHFNGLLEAVGKAVLPQAADEIDGLRTRVAALEAALAEAGRCPRCSGTKRHTAWRPPAGEVEVDCGFCLGTGSSPGLSPSTRTLVEEVRRG